MKRTTQYAAELQGHVEGLDGLFESLNALDSLWEQWAQELRGKSDGEQLLDLVTVSAGCYFGEVLPNTAGGEWRFNGEGSAPTLVGPGCTISPVGRAARFFEEGLENGVACLGAAYVSLNHLALQLEANNV